MLNRPPLLLLDEPTASIDPSRRPRHPRRHRGRRRKRALRRLVDQPQHVRGRGRLRPGAVPVARADCARRRSKRLPGEHGVETLDELFVAVAHEALAAGGAVVNRAGVAVVFCASLSHRGSPSRVFPIFIWVAVDILLWGFLTRYLNSMSQASYNFVPALLGAVLLWDFLTRVMQGVTMAFFEDVWSRNFLNLFATPLRISEYLTGLVITAIGVSALSLVAMIVFARVAFGLSFLTYGVALAPFIAVLFLTGIAMGVAAAGLVLRLGPASEWLIWPIPMIVSPFAGVFYPLAVLPGWMRAIAAILPPSYVFEGMRAVVAGEPAHGARSPSAQRLPSPIWFSPACSSAPSTRSRSAAA